MNDSNSAMLKISHQSDRTTRQIETVSSGRSIKTRARIKPDDALSLCRGACRPDIFTSPSSALLYSSGSFGPQLALNVLAAHEPTPSIPLLQLDVSHVDGAYFKRKSVSIPDGMQNTTKWLTSAFIWRQIACRISGGVFCAPLGIVEEEPEAVARNLDPEEEVLLKCRRRSRCQSRSRSRSPWWASSGSFLRLLVNRQHSTKPFFFHDNIHNLNKWVTVF